MTEQPFRHLCPDADRRDAMTDEEFWAHVYDAGPVPDDDFPLDEPAALDATTCGECGETGACAWDSEGRPLIHATSKDDDE